MSEHSTNTKENGKSPDYDNEAFESTEKYELPTHDNQHHEESFTEEKSTCKRGILAVQDFFWKIWEAHRSFFIQTFIVTLVLLYYAYFVYAMWYSLESEQDYRLLVMTIFFTFLAGLLFILRCTEKQRHALWKNKLKLKLKRPGYKKCLFISKIVLEMSIFVFLVVYIIVEVALKNPSNLIGLLGQIVFILLLYITSVNPAKVNWHTVYWGFALQYILALLILRVNWVFQMFLWMGDRVKEFIAYADVGAIFVFGAGLEEHFFAFKVLPIIVLFYAFINILFYLGVMQFIIRVVGSFLAFCLQTTPAESLNAAGNIFVGMTEAPLMIRPFLKDMTKSELHAVMTGGFATIAGSVLGAYISFDVPAHHLLAASVMSAPAALAISKLSYPETEQSKASDDDYFRMEKVEACNLVEAASNGASSSVKLIGAIAVNIIAFLALLALVDASLTYFGNRVGIDNLTLELIWSYIFYPISYLMGAHPDDSLKLGKLLGMKTFTNEFIAYSTLGPMIINKDVLRNYTSFYGPNATWYYIGENIYLNETGQTLINGILYEKTEIIATYALCGFANFGSMGILLGGLGALAPTRRSDLASMVKRAMVGGTVACFITACIAGIFAEVTSNELF